MNLTSKIVSIVVFSILFCFFGTVNPITASAQIPSSISGIEISAEPKNPQPGDTVTVDVKSYITDLNGAKIFWYENQKAITASSGTGKTQYTFTAPKNGTNVTITAIITTIEGKQVQKAVTIQVNTVDLIFETNGFTPQFYRGKAPVAYQNSVKVTAFPHFLKPDGTEMDPKKLIYKWKKNTTVLQDGSGFGQQSVVVTGAVVPRPYNISVEVSSADGKTYGEASIYFEDNTSPSVVFYEDDPIYGTLYNNALGKSYRMKNSELNVLAVPFSFNTSDAGSISYVWSVGGAERPDLGNKRSVTLRVKNGVDGNSTVSIDARNQESILQGAGASFTAYFNSRTTSGYNDANNTFTNPF